VKVDPTLNPGGCVFESDLGILDASLHTQLEGLRAAMDRAVRAALSESDEAALPAYPSEDGHRYPPQAPELDDDDDLDSGFEEEDLTDEEGALHG
jgi:type III secretion protein L